MEFESQLELERRIRSIEKQMNSLSSKLEDSLKWQQILEPWLLRTFNMNMTSLMNLAKLEAARSRISTESYRIKPSQAQRSNSSQLSSRIPSGESLLKRKRLDLEEFQDYSLPENRTEVMTVSVDPSNFTVNNLTPRISTVSERVSLPVDPISTRASRNNGSSISSPPQTELNSNVVHEILEDVTPVITITRQESLSDFPSTSRGVPSRLSPANLQSQDQNTYHIGRCDTDDLLSEEQESVLCSDIKIEVEEVRVDGEEIDGPNCDLMGSSGVHKSREDEEISTFSQRIDPSNGSLDFEEFSIDVGGNVLFPSPSASGKLGSLPEFQTRVTKALQIVKTVLKQHEKTLNILMEVPDLHYEPIVIEDEFVTLPVSTTEELLALDKIIKESEDFRQRLVLRLGNCVRGLDDRDATKRIMAQLITNELADKCDWTGKMERVSFSTLAIKYIVFSAVKQYACSPNTTEKCTEQFMKLWLKYAAARHSHLQSSQKNDLHLAIDDILTDPDPKSEPFSQVHIQYGCNPDAETEIEVPVPLSTIITSAVRPHEVPNPTKPQSRRHRSSVYGYFDWNESDGKYHCKYCSASYTIDRKSGSTSGLLRHARKHFAHLNVRTEQEEKLNHLDASTTGGEIEHSGDGTGEYIL